MFWQCAVQLVALIVWSMHSDQEGPEPPELEPEPELELSEDPVLPDVLPNVPEDPSEVSPELPVASDVVTPPEELPVPPDVPDGPDDVGPEDVVDEDSEAEPPPVPVPDAVSVSVSVPSDVSFEGV
jgi:hypothetical protein